MCRMPLPDVFTSCFRGRNEAPLVAFKSIEPPVVHEQSQSFGATVVPAASGSSRYSCVLRNEDVWPPSGRNIPYIPSDNNQRTSFCVELHLPSTQRQPEQRSKVEYTTADELVKDVQNLRWLGQGAQGVVYEGTWQGATVAVKFSIVEDLDATAYELLFSRLLSHPNVVQTFMAKVAVLDERTIHSRTVGYIREAFTSNSSMVQRSNEGKMETRVGGSGNHGTAAGISTAITPTSSLNQAAHAGCGKPVVAAATGPIPVVIARGSGSSSCAAVAASGSGWKLATSDITRSTSPAPSPCGANAVGCCDTDRRLLPQSTGGLRQQQQQQPLGRLDSLQSDDGFENPFGGKSTFNDVREVLATMGARPGHFITQMVMEHCDHGSLHSAIQKGIFNPTGRWGPKLALRALIRTAREVAQGMFHLHSNSVLHGDLKPANVLLINSRKDRRGYVAKVSDFGMAQFCIKDHISNAPWGTLVYMAPERLLEGQLFPASDVYSFGVILWEMYHGQRPYEGMHAAQIVMACAQGSTCLEWSKDSCSEIARISRACMASSPHDRPTFAILMHELASLEDRVRMDGMRISKSFDAASGRAFSLLSSDATALQHVRTRTSCDLPKQRASLDVAVLFPSAARVAATAAAAATASAAPSSHRGSHGGPPPASRETCFRGRLSVDTSCRPGSQMGLYHAQPSTGASGDAGPVSHHQGTHAVPPSTKDTHAIPRAAGCIAGMCREGAQLGGEDKDAMLCCGGRVGNGCDVQQVNVVDPTGGGHSGGGCAAAIAAALAQQPNIATAVVYELLALLQQQQQPQQEQPRPEADGDMTNWAANAAGRRIIEIVGGGNLGHHSGGGLGTTAALQEPPLPAPSLALYPATINTCGPGCLADCGQPPSRPDGASEDKGYATPLAASRVLQPPRRSTSCGDSVLLGTAQAAPADGSAAAAAAGVAACGIERSRTDSVLESSGGACANHGDDGAWGECVEVASMALSSPGRWVAGSSLAPAESPLLTAADVVRDGIAAAAANAQHRQLPQQCNSSGAVMCGVSLARRRSSNLSISCRNSTVAGWECTTITEEPT